MRFAPRFISVVLGALLAIGCSKKAEPKPAEEGQPQIEPQPTVASLRAQRDAAENEDNDMAAALRFAEQVVALERTPADVIELGRLLRNVGQYNRAAAELRKALAQLDRAGGNNHKRKYLGFYELGGVLSAHKRSPEALAVLRSALEHAELGYGKSSAQVARALESLGAALDYAGQLDEAEKVFRRSVSLYEGSHGTSSAEVGHAMVNLAVNLEMQKRDSKARDVLQGAVERLDGHDDRDAKLGLAQAHNGLGRLHRTRQPAVAEKHYLRSLQLFESELGPDHPLLGTVLHNLGVLAEAAGKLDKALQYCLRVRGIRRRTLNESHPHRVNTEAFCADLQTAIDEKR